MVLNPRSDVWVYFDNIAEEGVAVCKICKQRLRGKSQGLRKHMRTLHNTESAIWKYFDNLVREGVAVCKTCKQRVRNNRCFNLIMHMKKLHDIDVEPTKQESKTAYSSSQRTNSKRRIAEGDSFQDSRAKKRLYIEMEEKTIVRAVMGLMIDDGVAPELFDSKNMHALLQPMCEAISYQEGKDFKVNEAESERVLSLVANHIRNDFSTYLHWRLLSLKIDSDLNSSPKTFFVSALYVNEGQVEAHVLGIIDLREDCQLSEKHIKEVLHKSNIDSNQIVAVCWDNTKTKYNQPVKNSEYFKEIQNFESYPDIYLGDIRIERYLGVIAQLCLLDIFKNSNIFQLFLECRNLAKFINDETNGYYGIFEKKNFKIPQLDTPWKWGSTYTMIKDLYEARSILENVKYEKLDCPKDQFNLNDNLWAFMDAFCKSLSFIQKTIHKCYSEELHYGDFYAQWLKCKLLTEKLVTAKSKENNHILTISKELLKRMEKRSKELLSQVHFEACLYLDPRFQHTLSIQHKCNALEYLKKLWNRSKMLNGDVVEDLQKPVKPTEQYLEFDDDEDAFLNEFLSQDIQINDTITADVYNKIEGLKLPFQAVDTNILYFWKDHKISDPEMYSLSEICFAIPATQIYNKMYSFQTDNNTKLSAHTKENLSYIRVNSHLLQDAVEKLKLFNEDESSEEELSEENDSNGPSTSAAAFSRKEPTISDKV